VDVQVIPRRLEDASSTGVVLTSVLSTRLKMESEDWALSKLCQRITDRIKRVLQYDPTFMLIAGVLKFVAHPQNSVLAG